MGGIGPARIRQMIALVVMLPSLALVGASTSVAQSAGQRLMLRAFVCPVDYAGDGDGACIATRTVFAIDLPGQPPQDRIYRPSDAAGMLTVDIGGRADGPVRIAGNYAAGAPRVTCEADGLRLDTTAADRERPSDGVLIAPDRETAAIDCRVVYLPRSGMADPRPDRSLILTVSLCPDDYAGNDAVTDCAGHPVTGVAIDRLADPAHDTGWRISNAGGQSRFDISTPAADTARIMVMG